MKRLIGTVVTLAALAAAVTVEAMPLGLRTMVWSIASAQRQAGGVEPGPGPGPAPGPDPVTQQVWTVTFDAQGGVVAEKARAVTNGCAVGELPMSARDGFAFDGWWTVANGGTQVASTTIVATNVTYYAHWTEDAPVPPDPAEGFAFAAPDVRVDEGGTATIRIGGGNADKATSVKLYLSYNTAVAADIDLKNGKVDGSAPKGGLKFPLALSWAKGEVGEKTVAIPVKADKAVENDEFFTLQLAGAQGIGLGKVCVCTVTVHDPGYDTLASKIAAGTATKAEKSAWEKLQKAKAPYIRGLANPADGGKVSGSGLCATGKKVTLKATANKNFTFLGWTAASTGETPVVPVATTASLVIDRSAKPAKGSKTSTTLTNVAEDATFYAMFKSDSEVRDTIALSVDGVAAWDAGDEGSVRQAKVYCGVALKWPVASTGLLATAVKVTGLPSGLKFTAKDIMRKGSKEVDIPANTIYGAPTAASKKGVAAKVKFTVSAAGKSFKTLELDLVVLPLPDWATGAFDGAAGNVDGLVSLTVAANGKISGKLIDRDGTWSLSAASYDEVETGAAEEDLVFVATVVGKSGKRTFTNELEVAAEGIRRAGDVDSRLRGVASCQASSTSSGWTLWQNLWKTEPWKTDAKQFAKAKPNPLVTDDGVSIKFAGTGAVTAKYGSYSCSTTLIPLSDWSSGACSIFLYFPKAGMSAEIPLKWDEGTFLPVGE